MSSDPVPALERTAIEACRSGGAYLREAYRGGDTEAEAGAHDVKSSADTGAERRVLEVIRAEFPDHPIVAEESGRHGGGGEYTWLVDPLDGTNNFESGLPSFATAVTVLETGEETDSFALEGATAVLGVVYVPLLDDCYVARRGSGVRYNDRPVSADSDVSDETDTGLESGSESDLESASEATDDLDPETATVVSVIGHDVKRHPEQAAVSESINRALEARCKRRLESWSPTVHWGLLARGRLDGIVCYRPDREEQLLGELFASEAGLRTATGETADGGEWFVGAATDGVFDELLEIADEAL